MPEQMIKAATLFSSIGAPEVAVPHWNWLWHAEIENFPSAVMKSRHPHSVNLGDVCERDFVERAIAIGRPDVIIWGAPCQDFSVAGKRAGMDGARGNLAFIGLEIIACLRPRWMVFENVPGLVSSFSGSAETEREVREGPVGGSRDCDEDSDFAAFLSAVRKRGYLGCYRILDAQFSGVPQRRRRVFFVGHLGDWRPPAAVLFEPESLRGDHPPCREPGKRVAPTVEARADAGGAGWGTDFMTGGGQAASEEVANTLRSGPTGGKSHGKQNGTDRATLVAFGGNRTSGSIDVATAIRAKGGTGHGDFESETFITHALTADGYDASEDGTGRGTPLAFSAKDHGADAADDIAPTLRSMSERDGNANAGGQLAVAFDCKAGGNTGFAVGDQAGALRGDGSGGGHAAISFQRRVARNGRGSGEDVVPALSVAADSFVRRLTPRECERLQGFPDDYSLVSFRGKPAADGPRYKALGNAMCVKEISWILKRIESFEETVGR